MFFAPHATHSVRVHSCAIYTIPTGHKEWACADVAVCITLRLCQERLYFIEFKCVVQGEKLCFAL